MEHPEAVKLAHQDGGDGPLVLVLHGLLGQSKNWQAIAKRLRREFRTVTVDLRNHGASPWSDRMDYQAMAADIVALLDELGADKAAIVGHSMGGKAAMRTALETPDRVRDLVAVDIAPVDYGGGQGFGDYLDAMSALDLSGMSRRAEVERALARSIEEPAICAFLAMNVESGNGGLRWIANLEVLRANLDRLTGWENPPGRAFDGPTIFLRGGASHYVREENVENARALFPRAELRTVEGAGHWVHAQKPEETIAALFDFLST